jgi:hypothetical protein
VPARAYVRVEHSPIRFLETHMTNGQPAPGWYPDHNDPSTVRYWDGNQWTQHTAPRHAPATPAAPLAQAPNPGGGWIARHKAASIVIGVVGALVLMGIIGAATGSTEESSTPPKPAAAAPAPTSSAAAPSEEPSETAEPTPSDEASEVVEEEEVSQQDEFVAIVEKGHDVADSGNEIAVVQARKQRGKSVCALLGSALAVKDWHGTVESVETELGGDAGVLAVTLTDDIAVQTWNNGISDIGAGTLINPNSKVYAQLAQLEEGDDVTFSGRFVRDGANCVEEQSLMDVNGMLTPDFSFRFSAIKAD